MTNWDPWNYPATSGYAPGVTDLAGYSVEATDGSIGHVDEATHDAGGSYLVVDTGPWIFGSLVMLPAGVISQVDVANRKVYVARTKEQIKDSPPYGKDLRDDATYRDSLGTYYGRPFF
ncbi:hypothetical protein [Longispora albida]|uniref:hypothetical protein n=1 Tax=Longispora albida TaxID=203523 RepID=UPI0003651800|nr:hypothetical protein [Longispora albida]